MQSGATATGQGGQVEVSAGSSEGIGGGGVGGGGSISLVAGSVLAESEESGGGHTKVCSGDGAQGGAVELVGGHSTTGSGGGIQICAGRPALACSASAAISAVIFWRSVTGDTIMCFSSTGSA